MKIERVHYFTPKSYTSSLNNQDVGGGKPNSVSVENSKQEALSIPSVEISGKQDLKEIAREMLNR